MATEITLPEMGEGVIEGTISRWLVQEGDTVDAYDALVEVETDKVTTEIISEVAGTILQICVEPGNTVPVDTVLAMVGNPDEVTALNGNGRTATTVPPQRYTGRISPVVGRIAAEHEVDLNLVNGSGRDGRITKRDILAYIEQRETKSPAPSIPVQEPSSTAPLAQRETPTTSPQTVPVQPMAAGDELMPLNGMRRAIAEHMVRSKQTSPHVTTVFEFDFTAVADHRKANKKNFQRDGAKLTFTVYIVAAIVQALKQHPQVNSMWTDEGVLHKREINIGMATAVSEGLLVPVIKHADELNLLGLARTINDLALRARNKQIKPGELQGGTFSLTNHGTSGSLFATPIINQPQCGILGIGKIEKRIKVINDAIAIRPLAYASFTFDHRILDGATADAFVSTIKDTLENWP